jgi:hypothetical protein
MPGADRNVERISVRSLNRMWQLFDQYEAEVNASLLSPSSKADYLLFASFFMRWIDGDFTPGGTLSDGK